jgi:hypothetical protein
MRIINKGLAEKWNHEMPALSYKHREYILKQEQFI